MQFLADVELVCEECKEHGSSSRFSTFVIAARIHEVLSMTVREAITFFREVPKITNRLRVLTSGWVTCGWASRQRRCPAAKRNVSSSRPTCSSDRRQDALHLRRTDHRFALRRHQQAARRVSSADRRRRFSLVIEHNLDVIKTADHIIDLGAEGGDAGGYVVGVGTPEEIMNIPESYTGRFLRLSREIKRSLKESSK